MEKKNIKMPKITNKGKNEHQNNAYKVGSYGSGTLKINNTKEGQPLEEKIEKMLSNKEPMKEGAPIIHTERKDGVKPQYNIRTDRWEVAVDAMDKVKKSYQAKREERHKEPEKEKQDDPGPQNQTGKQQPEKK